MSEEPLVSVVIPVYNAEQYLGACLDSLLAQTYTHFELLVCNNGSTDGSAALVQTYRDARIRLIDASAQQGVCFARNTGLEAARGSYITFVDADDWVASTFFQEAVEALQSHQWQWVMGGTCKVSDGNTETLMNESGQDFYEFVGDDISLLINKVIAYQTKEAPQLDSYHAAGPWCKMMTAELCDGIRFNPQLTIGEDTVFNVDVLKNASRCGVVKSPWYYYRKNPTSALSSYTASKEPQIRAMVDALRESWGITEKGRYYCNVRGLKQLGSILGRAKKDSSACAKSYVEMLQEPTWKSICSEFSYDDAPLSPKIKAVAKAVKSGSSTLLWLALKCYGI